MFEQETVSQTPRGKSLVAAIILAATACSGAAFAQGGPNPPPRQDTTSAAGVSLGTGAFNHSERDLAIGAGAFPGGLMLERTYLSSLASFFSAHSGYGPQGWSSNLNMRIGTSVVHVEGTSVPESMQTYLYSVSIANRSVGFTGGSTNPTGGFVGTYEPVYPGGETLEFVGSNHSTGHFVLTDGDGTRFEFNPQSAPGRAGMQIASMTAPDGTRADFSYDGDGLRSVISSRGYALLFEYGSVAGGRARTKACAVNMTTTYVTATSQCPAGAQTILYNYSAGGSTATGPILASVTNAAQQTTSYTYTDRMHLGCVTLPGQTSCQVTNVYSLCEPPPPPPMCVGGGAYSPGLCELEENPTAQQEIPPDMRIHEQVRSQVTATGETYSYSFPATRVCPPPKGEMSPVTMIVSSTSRPDISATTTVTMNDENVPGAVTDPLNRTTSYGYTGRPNWNALGGTNGTLSLVERPELNRLEYSYDSRGNMTVELVRPKPGSNQGEVPISRTAFFPAQCGNRFTCNQPQYVTDARNNSTDYTYDPAHGGVLTQTAPAASNGVRPQVRYTYQQRYAWILNASGGYSPAATPVWVRISESRCRTSAATGNPASPCLAANDQTLTTYDYGPNSGPNNLLLRGQIVSGGGLSARTCFSYDLNGNRISETGPGAQLAACP